MKSEEEDIELIEAYIKSALSPVAREAVERRLREDPGFAAAYEDYRTIMTGIYHAGEQSFRAELDAWDREGKPEEVKNKSHWLATYWPVAATLLVLMLALTYFLVNERTPTTTELVAEVFEPYPDVISLRGTPTTATAGMEAYSKELYTEAIASFETWLAEHPDHKETRFYLGCAQLAAGRYEDAIKTFDALQQASTIFSEQIQWYRALAYLGGDRKEEATRQLENIAQTDGHDYSRAARTLLERL